MILSTKFAPQLTDCSDEMLIQFTMPDSSLNISDLLTSAGFPHLYISPETQQVAFECCLLYEVITKRVAALNDMRRGLQKGGSVKVMGTSLLDLLKCNPIQDRLFPKVTVEEIHLSQLAPYIVFKPDINNETCLLFDKYLDELNKRNGM